MSWLMLQIVSIVVDVMLIISLISDIVLKMHMKDLKKEHETAINKVSDELLKKLNHELRK
ncbi:hypothetical protein [Clostridioides difficile]|uniref:hypothetical protein n=1 Tax=Clostridioides difficile TaxID=1496 RepID=UPI00102748FD|nr:hypothetical protein [Clostridioides difficile]EGT3685806.1 hypothetical protein [Clostridioides difficile]MBZ0630167.1 hypothetical protein [Clostridioides difficile]MDV9565891.1 hypothetical protein [Clostridioides difficile]MDV9602663.1 hypothetical protein [Clostridioides difficile]VFE45079.1 Uncharacterised protein [Clostridioides difficile]